MSEYPNFDADDMEEAQRIERRQRELGAPDDLIAPYVDLMKRSVARAIFLDFDHRATWHHFGRCDGWTCGIGRTHRIPAEDIVRMRKAIAP